jgi:hypothetical protein
VEEPCTGTRSFLRGLYGACFRSIRRRFLAVIRGFAWFVVEDAGVWLVEGRGGGLRVRDGVGWSEELSEGWRGERIVG